MTQGYQGGSTCRQLGIRLWSGLVCPERESASVTQDAPHMHHTCCIVHGEQLPRTSNTASLLLKPSRISSTDFSISSLCSNIRRFSSPTAASTSASC